MSDDQPTSEEEEPVDPEELKATLARVAQKLEPDLAALIRARDVFEEWERKPVTLAMVATLVAGSNSQRAKRLSEIAEVIRDNLNPKATHRRQTNIALKTALDYDKQAMECEQRALEATGIYDQAMRRDPATQSGARDVNGEEPEKPEEAEGADRIRGLQGG